MIYWQLFCSFTIVGAFSFGGGYATMPLIQQEVVENHHWLSMTEFTHLITISQMTPGPIAVNSATFVGTKVAGLPGALVATIACILPSCLLVTSLAILYHRYRRLPALKILFSTLRPAVIAMIASTGALILHQAFYGQNSNFNWLSPHYFLVILFVVSLILLIKTHLSPLRLILLTGLANLLFHLIG